MPFICIWYYLKIFNFKLISELINIILYYKVDLHINYTIILCIGGLLCRAMIETVAGHNVHNFVSLSAPMMGQFGRKLYNACYIFLLCKVIVYI